MAVVYPLRPQLTTRDAKKVIGVIWLFALALVSPYIAVLELNEKNECIETFEDKGLKAGAYTISIFLLQYVVPLSVIGLSYIRWVNWWLFLVYPVVFKGSMASLSRALWNYSK